MLSFLKPKMGNVVGTAALLAVNWVVGFASRDIFQSLLGISGTDTGFSGRGAGSFAGNAGGFAGSGGGYAGAGLQMGGSMILRSVFDAVVLALAFYVVLSFVMDRFAPERKSDNGAKDKK